MVKPTTIYIDLKLLQAVKMKAVQGRTSVSHLVNEALKATLREDLTDLAAISSRSHESVKPFQSVLKNLKHDGLL